MAFKGAGKAGGTGGKFDSEDRSRDWYCPSCSERNFLKRPECHKCRTPRPADGGAAPKLPANGETLTGMVKSYNRKGFGFIMCLDKGPMCQDIYYSRENLHPALQTRDIPGEHVTFEIQRFHDGKLVAKNVRPVHNAPPVPEHSHSRSSAPTKMAPKGGRAEDEDRTRDWKCEKCGERNFMKRFECFKCKARKPLDLNDPVAPRRTFSPHAGARAIREQLRQEMGGAAGKRGRSGSGSSSSSSRPRPKKKKKKRRSSSSSSSRSSKSSKSKSSAEAADEPAAEAADSAPKNPEVEKAKADSLQKLLKLKTVEPMPARMKEYRELLRQWHPDKNPDKVEVATAVFQFLQKAKPMIADAK